MCQRRGRPLCLPRRGNHGDPYNDRRGGALGKRDRLAQQDEAVAALAGLELSADVTLPISSEMEISGRRCRLWSDPQYAAVTFASPDRLERAFREAVIKGEVEDATSWYRCRFYKSHYRETIFRFPVRTLRLIRQKLH